MSTVSIQFTEQELQSLNATLAQYELLAKEKLHNERAHLKKSESLGVFEKIGEYFKIKDLSNNLQFSQNIRARFEQGALRF